MRIIFVSLICLSLNTFASDLSIFCDKGQTPESCALKTESAVEKLGCIVDKTATQCTYSLVEDPKNPGSTMLGDSPYCQLTSINCSSPLPGNFVGENCFDRVKTYISKADHVHNGYWFGFWGSYSRTVCRSH